jgi:hypothetical protein
VKLSGLLFDAGPVNSPVLLEVGTPHSRKSPEIRRRSRTSSSASAARPRARPRRA